MHRLRGRTLGLVGYGRIARMTHEMLAGFGFARVLATTRSERSRPALKRPDVDAICREADLISLHAPLTPRRATSSTRAAWR
jgi:D-3-phosphoglycerate dehydrogenase